MALSTYPSTSMFTSLINNPTIPPTFLRYLSIITLNHFIICTFCSIFPFFGISLYTNLQFLSNKVGLYICWHRAINTESLLFKLCSPYFIYVLCSFIWQLGFLTVIPHFLMESTSEYTLCILIFLSFCKFLSEGLSALSFCLLFSSLYFSQISSTVWLLLNIPTTIEIFPRIPLFLIIRFLLIF